MADVNRFLLKQRAQREAAAKESARAAEMGARRQEFQELCQQRRTGCTRRVDPADAVDVFLRTGGASGSITLVPMSDEDMDQARMASASTLAECAPVSYDQGGLFALLKWLPALHVLDTSGMWNTCGLLAVLAAYLLQCSPRIEAGTVAEVKGLLRGSNSDGGRAVRQLACKEAAAAVMLLEEACTGCAAEGGGADEAEAMAEMLRRGRSTLADMLEPADGSRPQQLEYPQCMQFLQSVLPTGAAAEANLVVIQEGAVGLGPMSSSVAPAGLQVSCHLSEEASQGLADAQAQGQEFTLPMDTTCVVYLAAGHYQALALRGSQLRVGYPRAADGPTGPHEGGVLLLRGQHTLVGQVGLAGLGSSSGGWGGGGVGGCGGVGAKLSSCLVGTAAAAAAAASGVALGGAAGGVGAVGAAGSMDERPVAAPGPPATPYVFMAQRGAFGLAAGGGRGPPAKCGPSTASRVAQPAGGQQHAGQAKPGVVQPSRQGSASPSISGLVGAAVPGVVPLGEVVRTPAAKGDVRTGQQHSSGHVAAEGPLPENATAFYREYAAGTAEMSRHLAAALRPESGRAGSAAGGTADGADVAMAGNGPFCPVSDDYVASRVGGMFCALEDDVSDSEDRRMVLPGVRMKQARQRWQVSSSSGEDGGSSEEEAEPRDLPPKGGAKGQARKRVCQRETAQLPRGGVLGSGGEALLYNVQASAETVPLADTSGRGWAGALEALHVVDQAMECLSAVVQGAGVEVPPAPDAPEPDDYVGSDGLRADHIHAGRRRKRRLPAQRKGSPPVYWRYSGLPPGTAVVGDEALVEGNNEDGLVAPPLVPLNTGVYGSNLADDDLAVSAEGNLDDDAVEEDNQDAGTTDDADYVTPEYCPQVAPVDYKRGENGPFRLRIYVRAIHEADIPTCIREKSIGGKLVKWQQFAGEKFKTREAAIKAYYQNIMFLSQGSVAPYVPKKYLNTAKEWKTSPHIHRTVKALYDALVGLVVEKNVLVLPNTYQWRKSSTPSAEGSTEGRRSHIRLSAKWLERYTKKDNLAAYKVLSMDEKEKIDYDFSTVSVSSAAEGRHRAKQACRQPGGRGGGAAARAGAAPGGLIGFTPVVQGPAGSNTGLAGAQNDGGAIPSTSTQAGGAVGQPQHSVAHLQDLLIRGDANIFLSAPAGYGKTHLLRTVVLPLVQQRYKKQGIWLTATTGVAACAIDGTTIHSASGMGRFAGGVEGIIERMTARARQRWSKVRCIIIEECSMFSALQLAKLDAVARHLRVRNKFMGGIRLILVGDFMQLPPAKDVVKNEKYKLPGHELEEQYKEKEAKYAFEDSTGDTFLPVGVWSHANFQHLRLTFSWRHQECPQIAALLAATRCAVGQLPSDVYSVLKGALKNETVTNENSTMLVCKRKTAAEHNNACIDDLEPPHYVYTGVDERGGQVRVCSENEFYEPEPDEEHQGMYARVQQNLDDEHSHANRHIFSSIVAAPTMRLAAGCKVIACTRITTSIVNGCRGEVVGFWKPEGRRHPEAYIRSLQDATDGGELPFGLTTDEALFKFEKVHAGHVWPLVEFQDLSGQPQEVVKLMPHKHVVVDGNDNEIICSRVQLPVLASYALTIHKAQGMTLGKAAMNLGNCFAFGQMYSALGRVRTLQDLKLVGSLKLKCKLASPVAVQFERSAAWVNINNSPAAMQALAM